MQPAPDAGRHGRRRLLRVGLVGLLAVVGTAGLLVVPRTTVPPPQPPPIPLVVTASRSGGALAYRGFPTRVSAHALGVSPIVRLELWEGARRVDTADASSDSPAFHARWDWTPEQAGEAILIARAVDGAGRVAQSRALRITVLDQPPPIVRLEIVPALEGETLEAVVARSGGDLRAALRRNPGLMPGQPLAAGTEVAVPVTELVTPPPAARTTDGDLALVANSTGLLVPPAVTATADGCAVDLTVADKATAETGLAVYQLSPGADSFTKIATFTAASGGILPFSAPAVGGTNLFSVSAFDTVAETQSDLVAVNVPPECGQWSGQARLLGGKLIVGQPVDRAYFYLSVDRGPWQRVPADPTTFIEAQGGILDASQFMTTVAGSELHIEAWGWRGGQLLSLGSGKVSALPGLQVGDLAGLGIQTSLYGLTIGYVVAGRDVELAANETGLGPSPSFDVGPGKFVTGTWTEGQVSHPSGPADTSPRIVTFGWKSNAPGVSHVIWQVTPYPLGGAPDLDPPWLLASGTDPLDPGTDGGTFTVDFQPLMAGAKPVSGPSGWSQSQVSQLLEPTVAQSGVPILPGGTAKPTPAAGLVKPGGPVLPGGTGPTPAAYQGPVSGPTAQGVALATGNPLAAYVPDRFYVRVIPIAGSAPAGNASGSVRIDVVDGGGFDVTLPSSPPDYSNTHAMSFVFWPPRAGDPKYERCVLVVDTPNHSTWTYKIGTQVFGTYTPNKTVLCYQPPDDDGWSLLDAFEAFVEFVEDVWDAVSDGMAWIKQQVVSGILAITPCKAIASDSACTALANAAVDALLVSAGIPPSIPNFGSVVDGLKGDLANLVVQQIAAQVPAVGTACAASDAVKLANCQELVKKAIDKAVTQVAALRSAAAASSAGVFVPPGVTVILHPDGQWQPARFAVTLTRLNVPFPTDKTCRVSASMSSSIFTTWTEVTGYNKWGDVSGTVTGQPFAPAGVTFPHLEPGQSATRDIWLTERNVWFESNAAKTYYLWNNAAANEAYRLLLPGAQLTAGASTQVTTGTYSSCAPDVKTDPPITVEKYAWK